MEARGKSCPSKQHCQELPVPPPLHVYCRTHVWLFLLLHFSSCLSFLSLSLSFSGFCNYLEGHTFIVNYAFRYVCMVISSLCFLFSCALAQSLSFCLGASSVSFLQVSETTLSFAHSFSIVHSCMYGWLFCLRFLKLSCSLASPFFFTLSPHFFCFLLV